MKLYRLGQNKSLAHYVDWEIRKFKIKPGFRISQLTSPFSDAFLRNVLVSLCSGAEINLATLSTIAPMSEIPLAEWIQESKINLIYSTPSLFQSIDIEQQEIRRTEVQRYPEEVSIEERGFAHQHRWRIHRKVCDLQSRRGRQYQSSCGPNPSPW